MPVKTLVYAFVIFLHDLFTAVWMGGLLVTVIATIPAMKEVLSPGPVTKKVMAAFQTRQRVWVYISMAGLVVTGLLLGRQSGQFAGLFSFSNPYSIVLSIKHILVILMIGLTLYRSIVLNPNRKGMTPAKEKWNFKILVINAGLAVGVLMLSALTAAIARSLPGA